MSALNQAFSSSLSSLNWLGSQELPRLDSGEVFAKAAFATGQRSGEARRFAGLSPVASASESAASPPSLEHPPPSLRNSRILGFVETWLCFGGLMHTAPGGRSRRSGKLSLLLVVYSSFVFLVVALNLVRSAATLFGAQAAERASAAAAAAATASGSWSTAERALVFVWYATGTLTAIAFLASSARRRGVRRFRRTVDETLEALSVVAATAGSGGSSSGSGLRVTLAAEFLARPECALLVSVATGCTLAACTCAALALLDGAEHAKAWSWLTVLFIDSSSSTIEWVGRSLTLLATIYCSIACLWASVYASLLGRLIVRLHGELVRRWTRSLKQSSSVGVMRATEAAEIGDQRRMHGRLSALAAQLDAELLGWLFGLHQMCALLTVILAACALWQRRVGTLPMQQAAVLGCALVLAPLKMLVEIFFVADVRSEAMKSADLVFQFVGERMDSAVKAHLMRAQLQDTRGFTACGMCRIDRSSVVKIAAFFALAAIVLIASDGIGIA